MEIKCLVKIVVITPVQKSQYSTPVFIIPNKEVTVRFITDHRKLNQKVVRKMFTLTGIGNTMHQL